MIDDLQKAKYQIQILGPTLSMAIPPAKTVTNVIDHSPVAPKHPPKCR